MRSNKRNPLKLLFVTAVAVLLTLSSVSGTDTVHAASFPDTDAPEVLKLAENGIVKGNSRGDFNPNQNVTRAEAAIMMTRALNLSPATGDTPLTDIAGHFAEGEITRAYSEGFIEGNSDDTYRPDEPITRAQMAAILTRGFSYEAVTSTSFPDVPSSDFFHGYITTLANAGVIKGNSDGRFAPDENISRLHFSFMMARTLYDEFRTDFADSESPEDMDDTPSVPSNLEDAPSNKAKVTLSSSSNLNLRRTPNTDYTPIDSIPNGTVVDVIGTISGWAFIDYNGQLGYVSMKFLEFQESSDEPDADPDIPTNLEEAPGDKARVTIASGSLNLRSTPDTQNDPIGSLANGDILTVHGKIGNWAFIEYKDKKGYVSMTFIDFDHENPPEPAPSHDVDIPSHLTTSTVGIVARSSTLNIRPSASTNESPIGQLREGDMVNVHGTSGNWVEISTADTRGYVSHSFLTTMAQSAIGSLEGKTIVVDPGHGGSDAGGIGNGLLEKNVVLDIGLRVEAQLLAAGADVVMTRRTDIFPTLDERVIMANNSGADIFISLHTNAHPLTTARGTETFYNTYYSSGGSKKLADSLQKHMLRELNTVDRGVKQANFRVIRHTRMPSALVEFGFKTNAAEAERIKTTAFRESSADSMLTGTMEYFGK